MFKKLIFTISVGMVGIFTLISIPNNTYATGDVITDTIEEPTMSSEEALATAETFDTTTSETTTSPDETNPADETIPSDDLSPIDPVTDETISTAGNTEANSGAKTIINKLKEIVAPALSFIEEQFGVTIDRETVPLILSAAALILTVLLIIIINLIAHKKSRKAAEKSNRQELAAGLNANSFGELNNRPDLANGLNEFRDL